LFLNLGLSLNLGLGLNLILNPDCTCYYSLSPPVKDLQ
jgi:hypothetical protein